LFLFSVFLMFAIFSSIGGPFGSDSSVKPDQSTLQERAEARRARPAGGGAAVDRGRRRPNPAPSGQAGARAKAVQPGAGPDPGRGETGLGRLEDGRGKGDRGAGQGGRRHRRLRGFRRRRGRRFNQPVVPQCLQEGQGKPLAAPLQAGDQRLQILLGADSDLGALPVAAVPAPAALPPVQGL
jgi:hypothetical protein